MFRTSPQPVRESSASSSVSMGTNSATNVFAAENFRIVRAASLLRVILDTTVPCTLLGDAALSPAFADAPLMGSAYRLSLADPEWEERDLESRFHHAWQADMIPIEFGFYLLVGRKESFPCTVEVPN